MSITYKSCYDLPLYNFIKIVVTDDLTWLYTTRHKIKRLKAPDETLRKLWDDIVLEYSDLANTTTSNHIFQLLKELTVITNKLKIIDSIVGFLSQNFADDNNTRELVKILKSYGFLYTYSQETIQNDLRLTVSSAKRLLIQRQESQIEYDKAMEVTDKPDEKHYYQALAHLSKFMSFKIDSKTTTVIEYLSYLEIYRSQPQGPTT